MLFTVFGLSNYCICEHIYEYENALSNSVNEVEKTPNNYMYHCSVTTSHRYQHSY